MVFDWAAIPPEITSTLMYTGAGAGPLMAAATAYHNLAAELSSAAAQWQSILATLTTEQWTGAGSTAAAAAGESIVSWQTTTAAALEQAGAQATASAAAYEAAFAAIVPPPLIAENRARLAALVATNVLGVNTPAIMATEAQYAEMWVQDATTMYTYQAASTAAGILQPLSPETPATNPAAGALQNAATTQAATSPATQQLSSGLTNASTAATAAASDPPSGPTLIDWSNVPVVQNAIYNVGVTAAWNVAMMTATFPVLGHFVANAPLGFTVGDVTPLGAGLGLGGATLAGSAQSGFGGAVTAGLGEASSVGGLSVPASWSAATPATLASSTAPLEGSGWTAATAAEEAGPVTAMPGMPGMAAAAKGAGAGFGGPRYGFKPTVMPKPMGVG
ncbi:PPE family protein [Mycobacterium sp. SM1]|uniref:PPE family protein n=1 Tax=Mycobacterium sp. SM1 TaxID=2816243 RepID=UPI001BCBA554|nr:PPE family protein [Mycobacterium sp. SM1]MBS4729212.1 PPE family protein [Mycobacterium sp. SM1]